MGVTLTRALQWSGAESSGRTELKNTALNKSIMEQIVYFVEQINTSHPEEATFLFTEPLQWKSNLQISDYK